MQVGAKITSNLVKALLVPETFRETPDELFRIHYALGQFGPGRCFGLVKPNSGVTQVALLPGDVQDGDSVVCFDGAAFPYALRKVGETDDYVIIGEASKLSGPFSSDPRRTIGLQFSQT
jgi:hypothetical protein